MKIHEYQAKALLKQYEIPVPVGGVAVEAAGALRLAEEIAGFPVALKAQIHAGGRGKGGGVSLAHSMSEVEERAAEILGMTLVTPQTGPDGRVVTKILVEQGIDIRKELYLSIIVDRQAARLVFMASASGGMDIEEAAASLPGGIIKVSINPLLGLQEFHCRQLVYGLKLPPSLIGQFSTLVKGLYRLFVENDCTLVEINPLVITGKESLLALDAKIDIDANSLFRHPDIREMRDYDEEDPLEVEAGRYNLNYIKLKGDIGNMVNGAGLAMATMDMIKAAGAEPANFLDVGGGADAEMVANGFRIILSDRKVKGVLVNIFGGILRCDVLAAGIVEAARKTGIRVPVVVRMEGTNVAEGRKILAESGLDLITAADMRDAALKVAEIAGAE